jgi:hypothetical protein
MLHPLRRVAALRPEPFEVVPEFVGIMLDEGLRLLRRERERLRILQMREVVDGRP